MFMLWSFSFWAFLVLSLLCLWYYRSDWFVYKVASGVGEFFGLTVVLVSKTMLMPRANSIVDMSLNFKNICVFLNPKKRRKKYLLVVTNLSILSFKKKVKHFTRSSIWNPKVSCMPFCYLVCFNNQIRAACLVCLKTEI